MTTLESGPDSKGRSGVLTAQCSGSCHQPQGEPARRRHSRSEVPHWRWESAIGPSCRTLPLRLAPLMPQPVRQSADSRDSRNPVTAYLAAGVTDPSTGPRRTAPALPSTVVLRSGRRPPRLASGTRRPRPVTVGGDGLSVTFRADVPHGPTPPPLRPNGPSPPCDMFQCPLRPRSPDGDAV